VLEDAAHKLAAAGIGEGRVVDADGETLGTVRLERILAVIARPASAS